MNNKELETPLLQVLADIATSLRLLSNNAAGKKFEYNKSDEDSDKKLLHQVE